MLDKKGIKLLLNYLPNVLHQRIKTNFSFQFRFATKMDVFFIVTALICAMTAAISTPLNTLLIAYLLEAMVDYGISIFEGAPNADAFLDSLQWFAIYNCIVGALLILLSYAATTLMNIAAYNQVKTLKLMNIFPYFIVEMYLDFLY